MQRRVCTATAVVSLIVVGCAGNGSSNNAPPPGGINSINGQQTLNVQNGTSAGGGASAPGTVTSTSVTTNSGGTVTAGVPGGITIPPGGAVIVVPSTLFIDIEPVSGGGIKVKPAEPLTSGEVFMFTGANWTSPVDTGLAVTAGGVMEPSAGGASFGYYALPYPSSGATTNYQFEVAGPILVAGSNNNLTLNVSDGLYFSFLASDGGFLGAGLQNTYPTFSQYALPANGQSLTGSYLTLNTGGASTSDVLAARMTVNWPGRAIGQTHTLQQDVVALFKEPNNNSDVVPTNGITNAYLYVPYSGQ